MEKMEIVEKMMNQANEMHMKATQEDLLNEANAWWEVYKHLIPIRNEYKRPTRG